MPILEQHLNKIVYLVNFCYDFDILIMTGLATNILE